MKNSKRTNFLSNGAFLIVLLMVLCAVFGCLTGISFTPVADAEVSVVDSYYAGLDEDLTGLAFRSILADLITRTHTYETTYSGLASIFTRSDADPNKSGNILWFYTGTSVAFNGSGFGSSLGATNREHVWPKEAGKAFPETTKAGSDAHHLRPVEQQLNSTRNNHSFGEVAKTQGNIVNQAGSNTYGVGDGLCYLSGDFFYPAAGYRGATARILMYVQVRWGNDYQLKFVDAAGNCKTIGKISTLLKWHIEEPPTEEEKVRNEVIFGIQGNRNPFIDHPEYASKIFCYDGESYNNALLDVVDTYGDYKDDDVEGISLNPSELTLTVGQSAKVNATIMPSTASRDLTWTSSNTSVATVDQTGTVTAVAGGHTTITATSKKTPSVKATLSVFVKTATSISISGKPTQTIYFDGDTFNPEGLIVTAIYDDGSSGEVDVGNCEWLDGTTHKTTLSKGTTSVICKVGNVESTYTGIIVKAQATGNITITRDNFASGSSYGWYKWSSSGVSGYGYMYPREKSTIQMNNSKTSYYIYNTDAVPGNILSITIYSAQSEKNWEIRTSSTPYTQVAKTPTTGTSYGTKTASLDGTTWVINSSDRYFAINYTGSGMALIKSIVITYGDVDECDHQYGEWTLIEQPSDTSEGLEQSTCTACGESVTRVPASQEKEHFIQLVNTLSSALSQEAQFNAIKDALTAYNALSSAQKSAVASEYQTLRGAINAYNTTVSAYNDAHNVAINTGLMALAGAFVALSALVYLLTHRI